MLPPLMVMAWPLFSPLDFAPDAVMVMLPPLMVRVLSHFTALVSSPPTVTFIVPSLISIKPVSPSSPSPVVPDTVTLPLCIRM